MIEEHARRVWMCDGVVEARAASAKLENVTCRGIAAHMVHGATGTGRRTAEQDWSSV